MITRCAEFLIHSKKKAHLVSNCLTYQLEVKRNRIQIEQGCKRNRVPLFSMTKETIRILLGF